MFVIPASSASSNFYLRGASHYTHVTMSDDTDSAVFKAIQRNDARQVLEHCERGNVNIHRTDPHDWTPLFCAVLYANSNPNPNVNVCVLQLLLRFFPTANIDLQLGAKGVFGGWTLLHVAAFEGNIRVAKLLLSLDARADLRCNSGKSPAALALYCGYDTLSALINTAVIQFTPQ